MLISKGKTLFGILVTFLFCANAAVGQVAGQDTVSKTDSIPSGTSLTIVKDTLSNRNDTLANGQDTSSIRRDTVSVRRDTLDIITSEAGFNTVPGFRVQLMSTQNLLEAISAKSEADSLLSNYNVYIVYDSPYYKVRVGDFRARYEANQAVGFIAGHGFPDAWSVPDNVFRNPSRKGNH